MLAEDAELQISNSYNILGVSSNVEDVFDGAPQDVEIVLIAGFGTGDGDLFRP